MVIVGLCWYLYEKLVVTCRVSITLFLYTFWSIALEEDVFYTKILGRNDQISKKFLL